VPKLTGDTDRPEQQQQNRHTRQGFLLLSHLVERPRRERDDHRIGGRQGD